MASRVGVSHMEFYLILLNMEAGMSLAEASAKILKDGDKFQHFNAEIEKWSLIRRSV